MARTSEEEQKRKRRKRLVRGLLLGGAAVGLPAAMNALIARRRPRLRTIEWGQPRGFAWRYGSVAFRQLGRTTAEEAADGGSPVVLVHSLGPGHDSEEWRETAQRLAQHRSVYTFDLLGWGRSDRPSRPYDDELYVQLLTDFAQDVVGEKAVWVAAGLPAAYAVRLAIDHPELVDTLCAVVPAGLELQADEPDLKDALVHRLLRTPIVGTSALNLYTSRNAITQYLRKEVFAASERADASRIDHYYRSSHQPGAHHALAALLSGYLNHPVEELLERLTVPLWLAWGAAAISPRLETADLWLSRAPSAHLEVFPDCGNLPHLELPAAFANKLRSFLATPRLVARSDLSR